MGTITNPAELTESGERCLRRVLDLVRADLPAPHFVTASLTSVEAHVSRMLARLIVLSDAQTITFANAMIAHLEEDFNKSWESRMKWLSDGFGLSFAGGSEYQDLKIVIEARNAVIHGEGQLTDRQTKSLTKLMQMRKRLFDVAEIDCRGVTLRFSPRSVARSQDAIVTFVTAFDAAVIMAAPEARRL